MEMRQGPQAPEAAPLKEIVGPGGAEGVELDESFMVNSIVRKNPDGSLSYDCITGDKNAVRAVTEGKEADKPAKEDRHEQ
jgi:NADPH-dependent glutamate synthase beta subunit-like oxidoreductase